jgi:iron complex transport system permease protein
MLVRTVLSIVVLLLLAGLSLLAGRYPRAGLLSIADLLSDPLASRVILLIRLPRLMLALLTGAALGAAGCAFQLVFSNPLVDAGFLGVSQGASFGAALAMILGIGATGLFGLAFAGSILALVLSVFMAGRIRFGGAVLRLVLSGIAVSAFFSALVALLKYVADPLRQLPDIAYWMMGGLSAASWDTVRMTAPAALISVCTLVLLRWRTTILALDEATAVSLGARPRLERALVLGLAAFGVAAVTAAAGIVSWVGLIVPHVARLVLGSDGASTITGSAIIGAAFVLVCDTLSRTLFAGELPLGIATALLGTVLFFALLLSHRLRVERG